MSLETTQARAEERYWNQAWTGHKTNCPPCAASSRGNAGHECRPGNRIKTSLTDARAALKQSIALDNEPSPDQVTLF